MEEQNKMKHHENLNILTICRSCMDSNVKMKNLFEDDKIRRDYSSLSSLQVSPTDSLPEWLCWECCILLEKFAAFKRICNYSAGILLKYYSKSDPRASEQNIIKNERRKKVLSLTKSATFITEYPNKLGNAEEYNLISSDFKEFISLPSPEQVKEFEIKEESKADFESWYGEEMTNEDDSALHQDLKVEYYDDQFNDSDDEPVVKKIKIKKTKIKSNRGKRKKLKKTLKLPSGDAVTKKVYNTPAKNFDMSMVIISSLSIEEQLQEMADARNTEEYAKAPYKCESCAKWFVHEIVYKEHTTKHETVSGQYMCELCSQRFNSRRNLTNHQETHGNRYSCRLCGKVVISKQNIMSHMYTEHDQTNKQITCDLCQKTYKNRYTYAKHMRIHNNSKEYKCHLCPKVFLWKDNLNRHLTRHKSERPFSCDQCFKSFYLKENLKDHLLVHSGAKRFYCVECDLSYASQAKLNQHLKRGTKHLTPEQLTFPCTMCDVRYTNSLQLSMHIDRVHLNKRSHVCQQCDAAFVSKKTLQTHVRAIHEGYKKPKDHICETCGKGFSDKQVLKSHIRTHTGEKPFSCKYCGAKFAHSGAMYTHVKLVHLKQKRIGAAGKRKFEAKKPDEDHLETSGISQKDALVKEDNIIMVEEAPIIGANPTLTTLYVNRVNNSSHDAIS